MKFLPHVLQPNGCSNLVSLKTFVSLAALGGLISLVDLKSFGSLFAGGILGLGALLSFGKLDSSFFTTHRKYL